jgi:hypothetical protein
MHGQVARQRDALRKTEVSRCGLPSDRVRLAQGALVVPRLILVVPRVETLAALVVARA